MESWEPASRIRNTLQQSRMATMEMLAQRTALAPAYLASVLDRMEAEHLVDCHVDAGKAYWTLNH